MTLNEEAKRLVQEFDAAASELSKDLTAHESVGFLRDLPPVVPLADVAAAIKVETEDSVHNTYNGCRAAEDIAQRIAAALPEAEREPFLHQCGVKP